MSRWIDRSVDAVACRSGLGPADWTSVEVSTTALRQINGSVGGFIPILDVGDETALISWMTVKFLPRTQLLLFGVLVECFALAILIGHLVIHSASATWSTAVAILIATNILHAELISDLRYLRFFELMGCQGLARIIGSRSAFIANTPWLAVWPNLPFLALFYRAMEAQGLVQFESAFLNTFTMTATVLSVPVCLFLLDALRWRIFATKVNLITRREHMGLQMTVIGSYYASVESFVWKSVGEEKVNKAYAAVWISKVAYQVADSLLSTTSLDTLANLPRILVDVTLSSYVSMFGFCWIIAHVYHEVFSRWLFSMDIVFNSQTLSSQKYDFSGHLFVFFHQANITASTEKSSDPLTRLLLFLFLFRLSNIPEHVRSYSQSLSLDGAGELKFYLKSTLEGAVAPFLLGVALFLQVWRAPFGLTTVLVQIWERNLTLLFPPEFEMWIHSEALMAVGDLLVALVVAAFCVAAYPCQTVSTGETSHLWHRYLARVDFGSKVWLQVVRELSGIFIHLVIMAFMFVQLWLSISQPDAPVMGWGDLINFVVYFGRYVDGNIRFSCTTQNGIASDIVCSYRCVMKELPSPEEEVFAEWKDVCCICQATEEDRLALCAFPCTHFFHRECIQDWLKTKMSCPLCQRSVWLENGVVQMENMTGEGGLLQGPVADDRNEEDQNEFEERFDRYIEEE
ncbi:hypothetical protein BV898_15406 [Hypsibius exemplaris]|uniref:RING-type domain-containing protein n=1 Tax=Hypsibius exemplaris TaxID=2072580 RepID=A0A9X6NBH7_HYPEX|nr:hypothetical protein BV898_15406 [Hypsibius exemplaris]